MDQQLQLSLGLTLPTTSAPPRPPPKRTVDAGVGVGVGGVAQGLTCSRHHLQPPAQNVHIFSRPR